jgi:hypothetical protein
VAKYWSLQSGLEYAYVDRLFVTANWYRIDQGLGSQNSTTVTFFHPAQESGGFRWSYFEGLRLTRYVEDQRTLEAKYLHPVFLRGFKAGAFVAREWYREENDISYGSFQATSASSAIQPNTTAWSAAGIVPGVYRMRGWTFGAAFRYQLFDWLGFYYKLGSVRRSGSYDQGGLQALSVSQAASGSGSSAVAASQAAHLLLPFAAAQATDSGLRHNLEAVFRIYCRYSITIGVLREDLSRSYGSYLGYTFGTVNNLYSQKTPTGLGIGETSTAHELNKREIYLKFGTDFFF